MNDNSSGSKTSFIEFYFVHFVHVKRNWAHLAEKNSRPGARIPTIFRLS